MGEQIHARRVPRRGGPEPHRLDDAQLAAADDYEVDDYERVAFVLASGRTAWVYALRQITRT